MRIVTKIVDLRQWRLHRAFDNMIAAAQRHGVSMAEINGMKKYLEGGETKNEKQQDKEKREDLRRAEVEFYKESDDEEG